MIKPEALDEIIRTFEERTADINSKAREAAAWATGSFEQAQVLAAYSKDFGEITAKVLMKLLRELRENTND